MLRENNFLIVPATARNKYDLKGSELLVFGIIYGFSQDGKSSYNGGISYISEWTGVSYKTVSRILKSFTERSIIKSVSNAGKTCNYTINLDFQNDKLNNTLDNLSVVKNSTTPDKMSQVPRTFCPKTPDKMSYNNIDNINNNIKENIKEKKSKKTFKKPTIEELKKYCLEIESKIDVQRFFDYYEANGWIAGKVPMKNWKASFRNWTRNDFNNTNSSKPKITKHDYQKELTQKELDSYDRK